MILGRIIKQVNTKCCFSIYLDPFGKKFLGRKNPEFVVGKRGIPTLHVFCAERCGVRVAVGDSSVAERRQWSKCYQTRNIVHVETNLTYTEVMCLL